MGSSRYIPQCTAIHLLSSSSSSKVLLFPSLVLFVRSARLYIEMRIFRSFASDTH